MKGAKIVGIIILFGVALYLGLGFKKRMVQSSCKDFNDSEATKGNELIDGDEDMWYCCPPDKDKNIKNCLLYGE